MSHATQPRGAALQQATTIAGLILVFLITRLFTVVTLKLRQETMELSALDYLQGFALPNFYFHLTTAYDILRHLGMPVGKRDFLWRE